MQIQRHTVFDTPVLNTLFWLLASLILCICGWKIRGNVPPEQKKMVMIAAPHTSNWDFFWTLLLALKLRLKVYMMGKKELTERPLGFMLKWLGLIPIDRSQRLDTVAQAVAIFGAVDRMVLIIPPSGTRSKVSQWKTGFYHIAEGARVPIGLGYLDYAKKTGGMGRLVHVSGNYAADLELIREFYADIRGKYPEKAFGERPSESSES